MNYKDAIADLHQHNIIYKVNCPDKQCQAEYIGETCRRLGARIDEHAKRDDNSNVTKHAVEQEPAPVTLNDFTILTKLFSNHTFQEKEDLLIKKHKPSMNVKPASVLLLLFYLLSFLS